MVSPGGPFVAGRASVQSSACNVRNALSPGGPSYEDVGRNAAKRSYGTERVRQRTEPWRAQLREGIRSWTRQRSEIHVNAWRRTQRPEPWRAQLRRDAMGRCGRRNGAGACYGLQLIYLSGELEHVQECVASGVAIDFGGYFHRRAGWSSGAAIED